MGPSPTNETSYSPSDTCGALHRVKVCAVDILTEIKLAESVLLSCEENEMDDHAASSVHWSAKKIDGLLVECDKLFSLMPELFMRTGSENEPVATAAWAEPLAVAIQAGIYFCARCSGRSVRELIQGYESVLTEAHDIYIRAAAKTCEPNVAGATSSQAGCNAKEKPHRRLIQPIIGLYITQLRATGHPWPGTNRVVEKLKTTLGIGSRAGVNTFVNKPGNDDIKAWTQDRSVSHQQFPDIHATDSHNFATEEDLKSLMVDLPEEDRREAELFLSKLTASERQSLLT